MTEFAKLAMVNIECADARALTAFYHGVLGWEITYSDDSYGMISDGHTSIGFGTVAGYEAPGWPDKDAPKRYHLDFYVDSLDEAESRCRELGADVPEFQPGGERYRVLTDPGGHPFCLCLKS